MKDNKLRAFFSWLKQPVDPFVLGIFRIGYGVLMAYTMIRYFNVGLIRNMFVLPAINFQYDYLRWVKPLPEIYLNILLAVLLLCALAIMAGVLFKWACRLFAVGYAYLFLLDKSIYNNHIYLFILFAILLSLTDADQSLSLKKKTSKTIWIPRWQVFIMQAQILIVYFYGGIAKLTGDWLFHCQPVRYLIGTMDNDHIFAPLIKNEFGIYLLNYGGLFIDLASPLLLWYKPARKYGVVVFIIFTLMNSRIFSDIGIFPYAMLVSLLLFFETGELPFIKRLLTRNQHLLVWNPETQNAWDASKPGYSRSLRFLAGYFIFQLLFPFRGHFMPNQLDWTTIGNRFSWRMKVDTREAEEMNFYIYSPTHAQPVPVEIKTFINDMQIRNLSMDPRSVADFARFLKEEAIKYATKDPEIKASIKLRYNGRPAQYFVDPDVDLATTSYHWYKRIPWVYPVVR
jgi:vitamin K-dependent gamma-carboxylase